jgi:multidrug efflux system membrane fusion protein
LKVKEGDRVTAGQEVALITDQKLYLQIQGIDQRIQSLQAQRDKAKADFDRAQDLFQHGVTTKVLRDQTRTALDVAEKSLAAMRSDRGVVEQQTTEGKVLASSAGRVLTVPVSIGRAVMPGDTIATITEDKYILRLQLPERHARFLRAGDTVQIGGRGVEENGREVRTPGHVRLVYPQIQGGRVIADVEVNGLGDYFVGERTRVYVPTGKRKAIFLPRAAVYRRAGVDFVRLQDGAEIVVQTGEARGKEIEILSGLRDGDVVVVP